MAGASGMMHRMTRFEKPLVLFDGDCAFCRRWVLRLEARSLEAVEARPSQEAAHLCPELSREDLERAVVRVETTGEITRGAEAIFRLAAGIPGQRKWIWFYERVPGFAAVAEACYRMVAGARRRFLALDTLLLGRATRIGGSALTTWVFLRLLAVVYFVAFWSLAGQIEGLVGSNGILPAGTYLAEVKQAFHDHGESALARLGACPTVFWMSASDAALEGACVAGCIAAGFLFVDLAPAAMLVILWVLYLSLTVVGRIFLQYQWDSLLLETGLLALFVVPFHLWPRRAGRRAVPWTSIWLLRWLLFRLMFSSGVVKLLSGDPTWRDFSALGFHYESQPIPSWISWHAHQLPAWFHQFSVGGMFFAELVLPFFILLPRLPRFGSFLGIVALQAGIAVTGNYGYFNLLTIALSVLLLDDGWFPRRFVRAFAWAARVRAGPLRFAPWVVCPAAAVLFVLSWAPFADTLDWDVARVPPLREAYIRTAPFHVAGRYGLFAVMTTTRPELIFEGSTDGSEFVPYEFRYKPGALDRAPPFLATHMPRLDWQLWFIALGAERRVLRPEYASVLEGLLRHLRQGTPGVLALLDRNPFADRPPRHIRVKLAQYRFTDRATRRRTGAWWRIESETTLLSVPR